MILLLKFLGFLFAGYTAYSYSAKKQKHAENMLKMISPDITFDYNRMNVNQERNTRFEGKLGNVVLNTDVQLVQVANEELILKIISETAEGEKIKFGLKVFPFDANLLKVEHSKSVDVKGGITFIDEGKESQNLLDLYRSVFEDFINVKPFTRYVFDMDKVEVDPFYKVLKFHANFNNEIYIVINFNPVSYKLRFKVKS